MKSEKKRLRNKIVYNFIKDIHNIINRFINLNLYFKPHDKIKMHIN